MTREQAIKILDGDIDKHGGLFNLGRYLSWQPGTDRATLDSSFTAEELEAIAWWMQHSTEHA